VPNFDKIKEDAREMLTGSTPENDLRARLHADHNEVGKLIDELLASGDYEVAMRDDIRDQIVLGLTVHAQAEEEVVYDYLKQNMAVRDKVDHAFTEHAEIDRLLQQLKACDCADPGMTELVQELKQTVMHHVHDEENELLPKAEERIGKETLARLIPKFNSRKVQIQQELERTALPRMADNPLGETSSQF
jgi:hemerythrin superfamily protein